jgi:hypothetical protein
MQTNWRNFSSRIDVHENAPKRSLFVSHSSNDFDAVSEFVEADRPKAGTLSFGFYDAVTIEYRILYSGTGLTRYLKIDN